jgi:hypothetical protein
MSENKSISTAAAEVAWLLTFANATYICTLDRICPSDIVFRTIFIFWIFFGSSLGWAS